jgi:hypothetical protein
MRVLSTPYGFIALAIVTVVFQATTVLAQSTHDELRAAVQASLLEDPRTASLSPSQLDQMVSALTAAVEKKGLTVHDITWHPVAASSLAVTPTTEPVTLCGEKGLFVCDIAQAFGFSGPDNTIPIWLGITSPVLLLVLWGMIETHRRRHPPVQKSKK